MCACVCACVPACVRVCVCALHRMELQEAKKIADMKRREKMEEKLARYDLVLHKCEDVVLCHVLNSETSK